MGKPIVKKEMKQKCVRCQSVFKEQICRLNKFDQVIKCDNCKSLYCYHCGHRYYSIYHQSIGIVACSALSLMESCFCSICCPIMLFVLPIMIALIPFKLYFMGVFYYMNLWRCCLEPLGNMKNEKLKCALCPVTCFLIIFMCFSAMAAGALFMGVMIGPFILYGVFYAIPRFIYWKLRCK